VFLGDAFDGISAAAIAATSAASSAFISAARNPITFYQLGRKDRHSGLLVALLSSFAAGGALIQSSCRSFSKCFGTSMFFIFLCTFFALSIHAFLIHVIGYDNAISLRRALKNT
jgi:hypothetical protein